ncbi:MAG: FAD-dependent oxidoreductase, partial [Pseudonocardiaceae bacterium]
MRIAIVGAGLAGAMLAWRLRLASHRIRADLFTGNPSMDADATAASGGLVRAFETGVAACQLAAESLAELHASSTLRQWADYQEVGSVYLPPHGADLTGPVKTVDSLVADSVAVLSRGELARRYPFRDLPAGTTGVVERRAGYLSPARLRAQVLADLVAANTVIHRLRVARVSTTPAVQLADGTTLCYDVVVVAAGARTPR